MEVGVVRDWLEAASRVTVLTGAGISTYFPHSSLYFARYEPLTWGFARS